jgi:hypothetical protein
MFIGIGAGAVLGGVLGFAHSARRDALDGVVKVSWNPFLSFFNRSMSDITLFQWMCYFAAVLNFSLVVIALSFSPIYLMHQLDVSIGVILLVYACLIIAAFCFYPIGRKIWSRRRR